VAIPVVVAVGDIAGAIAKRIPEPRVGPGTKATAEIGPLEIAEHRDKVASYLDDAAEVGCGMVGVSSASPAPVAHKSVGGWRTSLVGDTHICGPAGVDFGVVLQTDPLRSGSWS